MSTVAVLMQVLESNTNIEILQREWDGKAQETQDALNTMESEGLATMTIDRREDDEGNDVRWRVYFLTDKGKQWLEDLRAVPNALQEKK